MTATGNETLSVKSYERVKKGNSKAVSLHAMQA
jgi:hypothetical protein